MTWSLCCRVRAVGAADAGGNPTVQGSDAVTRTIIGSDTAPTLMLAAVASLGVFNTVVLNARDRRRDLGMLKSIGMTPRQVTVMSVKSLAVLGSVLGIPLGIMGHHRHHPALVHDGRLARPGPDRPRDRGFWARSSRHASRLGR